MRFSILLVAAAALLGQRHEIPQLNSCIKEFYDPEMYNYLTFKNTCAQSVTMVYIAKDGSGTTGTMDLRPEGKDSIGKSLGKSPAIGSFEFFVCPSGEMPMDDETKQVVSKTGSKFHCEQKTPKAK
jgi:hypothetical protein